MLFANVTLTERQHLGHRPDTKTKAPVMVSAAKTRYAESENATHAVMVSGIDTLGLFADTSARVGLTQKTFAQAVSRFSQAARILFYIKMPL